MSEMLFDLCAYWELFPFQVNGLRVERPGVVSLSGRLQSKVAVLCTGVQYEVSLARSQRRQRCSRSKLLHTPVPDGGRAWDSHSKGKAALPVKRGLPRARGLSYRARGKRYETNFDGNAPKNSLESQLSRTRDVRSLQVQNGSEAGAHQQLQAPGHNRG